MEEVIYLDSNFFVYLFLDNAENQKRAIESLSKKSIYTSCLTYDEVVWAIRKLYNKETSIKAAELMLNLEFLHFIDLNKNILFRSKNIIEILDLKPRDSLHYASMEEKQISYVVTDDKDFSQLKNIKVISIENFMKSL